MKYSFVIPVRNGEATLAATLQSILGQALKPIEIIVVDNNSTDQTKQIAESFPQVNYYYCPKVGRSCARNFGASKAMGDYLVFIDADVLLDKDWLISVESYLEQMPCDAIFTKIIPQIEMKSIVDTYRVLRREWSFHEMHPIPIINTAASVFDRKIFLTSGGFNEDISRNEDAEFSIRLFLSGHILGGTSKAISWVRFYPEITSSFKRNLAYLIRSASVGFHSLFPAPINRKLLSYIWRSRSGIVVFLFALLVEFSHKIGRGCRFILDPKVKMAWKNTHGKKTLLFQFKHKNESYYLLRSLTFLFSEHNAFLYRGLKMIRALSPLESKGLELMLNERPINETMAAELIKMRVFVKSKNE